MRRPQSPERGGGEAAPSGGSGDVDAHQAGAQQVIEGDDADAAEPSLFLSTLIRRSSVAPPKDRD
ncbi:MAG: hypothetical protein FJ335_12530 [Sphingomonadales bacterium]|nr:hypothetical protein [Sphingomonadales bacterium]